MTKPQYDATDMDNFYLSEENRVLRTQRDEMLRVAKEATNGWACYAKRQIEHDEIARLHRVIATAEGKTADA